jgi:hypothetical protein
MNYTIVPDIHADLDRLEWSISQARNSKIIFLGDLVDAGKMVKKPDDAGVLERVSNLISNKEASCILGNHEMNAILFHRRSSKTKLPLRSHTDKKNWAQHSSFISKFGVESTDALEWTSWMLAKLPLWLEFDGLRIAHACWSEKAINIVKKRRPTGYLKIEDLEEIALKKTKFSQAVEIITSGPEAKLPLNYSFNDIGGHPRQSMRLSWWNSQNTSWRKAALSVPNLDQLPDEELPCELKNEIYNPNAIPVLVGHYKMSGQPKLQSRNASSLDYPASKCVYHWSGEAKLISKNLTIEKIVAIQES